MHLNEASGWWAGGLRRVRAVCAAVCGLAVLAAGCGPKYEARDSVSLREESPAAQLIVDNFAGDVVIRADANVVGAKAEVTMTGRGHSQREAEMMVKQISAQLGPRAGRPPTIVATTDHPHGGASRQYDVQWTITVSPKMRLRVQNVYGNIEIEGFRAGAQLTTSMGRVVVRDSSGGLTAITQEGGAEIEAAGRIDVRVDHGEAKVGVLAGNAGDVEVRTRVGDIALRLPPERRGLLRADAELGTVSFEPGAGAVDRSPQTDGHVECSLGGASTPRTDVQTEMGSVSIVTSDKPAVARSNGNLTRE